MTRRGNKTTTHVHRVHHPHANMNITATGFHANGSGIGSLHADAKGKEFLMRKHRFLRRATGFMLARKYRYIKSMMRHTTNGSLPPSMASSSSSSNGAWMNSMRSNASSTTWQDVPTTTTMAGTRSRTAMSSSKTALVPTGPMYSRDELINFWKDLPLVAKRALLRIHREVYLNALDDFLVRQNLCCECHDNVIAEWEDHERKRSGSRSLQDVFSVFPPFLDDEDDEDEDDDEDDDDCDDGDVDDEEDDDADEEDALCCQDAACEEHMSMRMRMNMGRMNITATNGQLNAKAEFAFHHNHDDVIIEEEELVFKYEIGRNGLPQRSNIDVQRRRQTTTVAKAAAAADVALQQHTQHQLMMENGFSDEYLAALEVGKRQEDELLRLIQKEERYIIIREDHTEFIMDLIRCGEQFSYVSPFRSQGATAGSNAMDDEIDSEDEDDEGECPGANTSHLAQEYLLEVLAIKFREQLESAYQAALQHSLAVQAELLRDEIADLQASQAKASASSSSKKKKNKKKKKKEAAAKENISPALTTKPSPSPSKSIQQKPKSRPQDVVTRAKKSPSISSSCSERLESDASELPEEDEIDREVEEFRLLLEKINNESVTRQKPKLVLPPGSFASMSTSFAATSVCTSK